MANPRLSRDERHDSARKPLQTPKREDLIRPREIRYPPAVQLLRSLRAGKHAAHDVGEVLIVDPVERKIDWLTLDGDAYRSVACSALIGLTADDLATRLDWS